MTDIDSILSRLAPPLRVEAFNHICAGKEDYSAMIVRDDEPGVSSILAQQMQDQTAHDICDLVNSARDTITKLRAEVERLRDHIEEQTEHVEQRIKDGIELGAIVWRITLEDVARENRAALGDNQ